MKRPVVFRVRELRGRQGLAVFSRCFFFYSFIFFLLLFICQQTRHKSRGTAQ